MEERRPAVITLHPWWAHAIVGSTKRVENRSWAPGPRLQVGDWLYIHAGARRPSAADVVLLRSCTEPAGVDAATLLSLPGGAILGRARYLGVDCIDSTPWDIPGWWHWRLGEVERIDPIACKGQLGLWSLPG